MNHISIYVYEILVMACFLESAFEPNFGFGCDTVSELLIVCDRCRRKWTKTSRCCVVSRSCLTTTAHCEPLRIINAPTHSSPSPKSRDNACSRRTTLVPVLCSLRDILPDPSAVIWHMESGISGWNIWRQTPCEVDLTCVIDADRYFPVSDASVRPAVPWQWRHITGPSRFNFRCADFIFYIRQLYF